jgi:glycosyltransferase involved in cell wall biosynthesis
MSVRLVSPALTHRSAVRVGLLRSASASIMSRAVDEALRAGSNDCHLRLVKLPAVASTTPAAVVRRSIHELSSYDVAVAQLDCDRLQAGSRVADVVRGLAVPTIVVLHSIPSRPTPDTYSLLVRVCDAASLVVVMSESAKWLLARTYPVDADKVIVIPWGASSTCSLPLAMVGARDGRHHILTWGDIAPGLGAEHVIDAVAMLAAKGNVVRYTIASTTYAHAGARDRSAYARQLRQRADSAGVGHLVRIATGTRDSVALRRLVASASLVVLPYDEDEHSVSPSLVESIAAGRPVIATGYLHAAELLRDGAGLLVPHRNSVAMAEAIRVATTDPCILDAMTRRARLLSPSLSWELSARRFAQACVRLSTHREMLAA